MDRLPRIVFAVLALALGLIVAPQVAQAARDAFGLHTSKGGSDAPKASRPASSTTSNNNEYVEYDSTTQQWGSLISTWTVPPKPTVNNGHSSPCGPPSTPR